MNHESKSGIRNKLTGQCTWPLVVLFVLSIAQSAHAGSCDTELKALRDWVNKPKSLVVLYDLAFQMSIVSDVKDQSGKRYVTYSNAILASGSDLNSVSGDAVEYFSDRVVVSHTSTPDQPFDAKKSANQNIQLNLNSGEIQLTSNHGNITLAQPECFGHVMFWNTDDTGYLVNVSGHETKLPLPAGQTNPAHGGENER
jgi:hypothetical protein